MTTNGAVRAHYNRHRPRPPRDSDVAGIRNFHNFVKTTLVAQAVADAHTPTPPRRFLDLCCGNGGDIGKLHHHGIREYVGIELANQAAERASERLAHLAATGVVCGDVVTLNAFTVTCGEMLAAMRPFDIVSCQFALHYAFASERLARTTIQNVAMALREGGVFIVTVPDAEHLAKCRLHLGRRFGDARYSISFCESPGGQRAASQPGARHAGAEADEVVDTFDDFGSAYSFSFAGSVDDLDEFVVKPAVLTRLCADCGMHLLASHNFAHYHRRHAGDDLWKRMRAHFDPMSAMYRTYEFRMGAPTASVGA